MQRTLRATVYLLIYYPCETDATDAIRKDVGNRCLVRVAGREIGEKVRMMPLGYLQNCTNYTHLSDKRRQIE